MSLIHAFGGHTGNVTSIAVTPDGRRVVSSSHNGKILVWDLSSGRLVRTLKSDQRSPVYSVCVLSDGTLLASGSVDGTVKIWELESGRQLRTLKHHLREVNCVAATPDGRFILSASNDGTVGVWDVESGKILRALNGHEGPVLSVAVTPDGQRALTGSVGGTVRVWDLESGLVLNVLQGHESNVCAVSATAEGRLIVSTSMDLTVRIWELRIWNLDKGSSVLSMAVEPPHYASDQRVVFTPNGQILLTVGKGESIQVWKIDWKALVAADRATADTVRYRNAKVVLVGDTGVGKSGLGTVLTGQPFTLTDSTHGRKVWLFQSKREPLPDGGYQTREVMLWDLAGQPGYRLVHQLNIDQAVIALVLVDARSETDPLGPAEYWARAIDQARSALPITKFLVVARIDRGGLAVNAEALDQFAQKFGFSKVFETSAKTGEGIKPLAHAISEAIHWDELEEVTSTELFTRIKGFLQDEKSRGDQALLDKLEALFEKFRLRHPADDDKAAFNTCITRLEAAGLVEVLRFTALGKSSDEKTDYVLLQPEYVDAYASAAVMTARKDPRGIGEVLEAKLLAGDVGLDGEERIPDKEVERRVLAVTIERLLGHDIALRERLADGDYLVFPSEYTRSAPFPRRNAPGLAFDFQGATRAIFTTLVVRLAHHRDFEKVEFYRDAACYQATAGGRCAVVLDETAPGQGRMSVYFEDDPSAVEQQAFLQFVREHLYSKAKPGTVLLHRLYFCRACGHAFDELAVQNRLKQGNKDIGCPNCDERSPLLDLLIVDDPKTGLDLGQIGTDADAARRRQLAATAIEGKRRIGEYDVFLSYKTADREKVVDLAEALLALGIRPWLDVWDLIPGRPWQEGLNTAIQTIGAAAVCVGPSGLGPWQDHEVMAFIRQFVNRKSPVIPILLPGAPDQIALPPLLESFLWVDMRSFGPTNPRPLANVVAGILGVRPRSVLEPDRLAVQVASILSAPSERSELPDGVQDIVLPVNLTKLNETEIEAVRQQTARLLGISSQRLKLKGTRQGSVKIILTVEDFNAVSQLFAMVSRSDASLQEFFQRCQINQEQFSRDNAIAAKIVTKAIQASKAEKDDPDPQVALSSVPDLSKWTGGAPVLTVAVVFTDIVDSTRLCNDLTDSMWEVIRQQHFKRAVTLIRDHNGILVKNTGDGVLALFHDATSAVQFAITLHGDTGNAVVRIRAGAHVGQVGINDDDAVGRHMNFTARVMGYAKADGVIVSTRIKDDIATRGDGWSKNLHWIAHPNVTLRGFTEPETLWAVEAS